MAIGDNAEVGVTGYVAVGAEASFGSYASSLEAIEALNCGFRTDIKSEKIPSISTNRGMTRRVQGDKEVAGSIEMYAHPTESVLIFQSALGGAISTTALSTGAYSHAIHAGNFSDSITSVSFNVRKGSALTWRYTGGRVNSLKLTAEAGSPLKLSADYIFKDSTNTTNDSVGTYSLSAFTPFTFVQGAFTFSDTAEKITGFELTINNNLKSDKDARALGQNTLQVLPATQRDIEFKITQRMATITAWTRFTTATCGAVQLEFTGTESITAAEVNKLTIDMPKCYYNSPDVALSPDEILISDIDYDVLVDNPLTTTGYDIKFTVINPTSSY